MSENDRENNGNQSKLVNVIGKVLFDYTPSLPISKVLNVPKCIQKPESHLALGGGPVG